MVAGHRLSARSQLFLFASAQKPLLFTFSAHWHFVHFGVFSLIIDYSFGTESNSEITEMASFSVSRMSSVFGQVLKGARAAKWSQYPSQTTMASSGAFSRKFGTGNVKLAEAESSANPQLHSSPGRMEKTVNHVTLMGRVGGDPQKRGNQEHPVVIFSLATHSNYSYQSGGILQKTDWHRICVFKPYLRETVYKYLNKGQRVYITGRISYGEIKDDNGNSHTTSSIIADDVIFVSATGAGAKQPVMDEEVD